MLTCKIRHKNVPLSRHWPHFSTLRTIWPYSGVIKEQWSTVKPFLWRGVNETLISRSWLPDYLSRKGVLFLSTCCNLQYPHIQRSLHHLSLSQLEKLLAANKVKLINQYKERQFTYVELLFSRQLVIYRLFLYSPRILWGYIIKASIKTHRKWGFHYGL